MPSQADLLGSHTYTIFEADEHHGELRTHNVPSDEVQREVATQREETSFFVYVKLATCLHGRLDGPSSEPASLIIFEYEVHSKEDSSVVKSIKTSFKFSQSGLGSPNVIAYAPYVRRRYNFSAAGVTHTQGVEASAGANAGPGEASATYSNQKETTHEQQYFEKVESWASYNETQKRHDEVTYQFAQNKSQKSGISPAILLKRSDDNPFKADFKIEFDGGFMFNAGRSFKKVFGRAPDDPINFDPRANPVYGEVKADIDALGQYAHGRELNKDLAPIWGVDTHQNE